MSEPAIVLVPTTHPFSSEGYKVHNRIRYGDRYLKRWAFTPGRRWYCDTRKEAVRRLCSNP
jgi:hypothetical protein